MHGHLWQVMEKIKILTDQQNLEAAVRAATTTISVKYLVACRRIYDGKRHSLEPVFGLSFLGYCRNMVVQHG